jgi:hypothetical protein
MKGRIPTPLKTAALQEEEGREKGQGSVFVFTVRMPKHTRHYATACVRARQRAQKQDSQQMWMMSELAQCGEARHLVPNPTAAMAVPSMYLAPTAGMMVVKYDQVPASKTPSARPQLSLPPSLLEEASVASPTVRTTLAPTKPRTNKGVCCTNPLAKAPTENPEAAAPAAAATGGAFA